MPFQFRKEAIEEDLNSNFPSQGQGNPPLYYSLSEVVVPTYSINNVAEGTSLPQYLQTAYDFSTANQKTANATNTIVTNTGFWQVNAVLTWDAGGAAGKFARLFIDDGVSTKNVWGMADDSAAGNVNSVLFQQTIIYLRSGDTLKAQTNDVKFVLETFARQVADINGNLVNPLGFSFA